jgi:OFA family oxalate/formate antiporter-like MFS transporter
MTGQEAIEPQEKIEGIVFKEELRGQWPLILVLFLMQVFAFGFPTFALPFVYSGAIEEFGWTRQEAVLLTSFKFYVSAIAALMVGRLLDIINPRYVIAVSAFLGALAMVGFSLADRLPIYYSLGVLLGLNGTGMAVSVNVIVGRSFEKSTGTILGIVLSGTSVAGMILPILMAPLMVTIGWRPAMALLSCGIWLVALPAWLVLSRKGSPIDTRLRKQSFSATKTGMWNHIKELSVTRDFWFIFIGVFLIMGVDQSLIQNQVLFLESEKGLNLGMVAWGASLLAGVGIGAKILFGQLFDRLSILGIIICYLLLAVSVGLSFAVAGIATMLIFMTVRGIAHGGLIVAGTVLLKHRYGIQNLGINLGIFLLATSLGFGFCPSFMANMADKSGTYSGAFALGTIAVFVAAILLFPVRTKSIHAAVKK